MRKNFILEIFLSLCISLLFLCNPVRAQAVELVYDNFNDGVLGPNLGGQAGVMSHDGRHDPVISFNSPNAYEGASGLKVEYNVPSGQWSGYWSKLSSSRNVTSYTDLRVWVKGSLGGEKFKIELADNLGNKHSVQVAICSGFENGATTAYQEVVIPLATFTGVNLTKLKEVNIVFDCTPYSGTVYIDKIVFSNLTSTPLVLSGLILDSFNDGLGPNELGGDCGTMDPEPADSRQTITENYVNDSGFTHEGLGALKIDYNRGNDWVGYWSYMKKDRSAYDLSSFTDIRINVRSNSGSEKFKVELEDSAGNKSSVDITAASGFFGGVPSSEYHEAILPLVLFVGVNPSLLKQVNIIFDQQPQIGTVFLDYIRFTNLTPPPTPIPGLIYDDFNDGILGPNLSGRADVTSSFPDLRPTIFFNGQNAYEGTNALEIDYSVPGDGRWASYWSRPNTSINVSGYTDLRLWIKGAAGGEKFKVELVDTAWHGVYITLCPGFENGATNSYQEAVIPLSAFAGANLNNVAGINVVFDRSPYSGIVYIDTIRFTSLSPEYPKPDGLIVDCFNNGTFINEFGGSSGIMNADAAATITTQYDTLNKYEGLAGLKLTYNRASSWVGYWTFMTPAGESDTFGRDVSAYKDLKVWVKGAAGGENFKIELKDANNNKVQSRVLTAGSAFEEKVIPLSDFSGIDLAYLKQISLIFDQAPSAGTIYLDCIRLTGNTHENQPPQATIDSITTEPKIPFPPDPIVQGQPILFLGHGTDSDGTVVAYNWRSSIDEELDTQSGFTKGDLSVGTHTIYFKVQDNDGLWSEEVSRILVINAPNPGPTLIKGKVIDKLTGKPIEEAKVEIGPNLASQYSFDPIAIIFTDAQGDYETEMEPDHSYLIRVTKKGYILETDVAVNIVAGETTVVNFQLQPEPNPNQPPQAAVNSITPNPAISGQAVTFAGSGTDSDGTVAGYNWRSSLDGQLSTQASFSKNNLSVGTHTIYFKVQDDDGVWSDETNRVLVINSVSTNKLPILRVRASPRSGRGPLSVRFYSRGSYDPDGRIVSYRWDFGDGKSSHLANPKHIYTNNKRTKTYFATLTVTDNKGGSKISSRLRIRVYPKKR